LNLFAFFFDYRKPEHLFFMHLTCLCISGAGEQRNGSPRPSCMAHSTSAQRACASASAMRDHTRGSPGHAAQQLVKLETTQSSSPMHAGGSSGKSAARSGTAGVHAASPATRPMTTSFFDEGISGRQQTPAFSTRQATRGILLP
jgi:hypothetical protein